MGQVGEVPRILVTRTLPSSVLAKLESVGEVDLFSGEFAMIPEELRTRAATTHAIVSMLSDTIDRDLIDGAPK